MYVLSRMTPRRPDHEQVLDGRGWSASVIGDLVVLVAAAAAEHSMNSSPSSVAIASLLASPAVICSSFCELRKALALDHRQAACDSATLVAGDLRLAVPACRRSGPLGIVGSPGVGFHLTAPGAAFGFVQVPRRCPPRSIVNLPSSALLLRRRHASR